jgi:Transposase DNA-binding
MEVWAWAERNFATAQLGDGRRTRRLVESAARIAAHPEQAFPQVFEWNDPRGFDRVCNRRETTLTAVMLPHWEPTRDARAAQPLVLLVHDTTELDFSSHHAWTGIGQIGKERGRGGLQPHSLAIVPQPRRVLGLASQQCRTRQPTPNGGTHLPTQAPAAGSGPGDRSDSRQGPATRGLLRGRCRGSRQRGL